MRSNKNLKLKDAFQLAVNDMTDELCLAWKPVSDYVIDNTLHDLAVKFSNNLIEHDRVLYYNVDWQQPVSKTYLKGLADFMEVFTDDSPDKVMRYAKSKAGSFIPNIYTKFVNDPFYRDTKSIFDEFKKYRQRNYRKL